MFVLAAVTRARRLRAARSSTPTGGSSAWRSPIDLSRDSTAYALTRDELDAVLGPVLAGAAPASVGTGDCLSE